MSGLQQETRAVGRPDRKELLDVAEETNAFLLSLMMDPQLDRDNVLASPKPIFNACDFARRTYLEYIVPLFPKDAPHKVVELANPFVFEYPDRGAGTVFFDRGANTDGSGTSSSMAWLESDEADWPEWTADLDKKYHLVVGRNVMLALIVLQGDEKGPMVLQGAYDFQPATVELAKGLKGERGVDYKERLRDARKAVGLAG
ncbi:hypothetical protein LTR99_000380 [Exophiala xenobiotica]|uniref:Uncharacterized protein n=1 Tax=Vermiconidia calcicola TaxID=1690605 RepID=A0AAV9QKQ1_9PEZI|nr:hypothetical protein H2202_004739 [Exophiala xenobiotica]KAK5543792.1 hypothetical protein LTR25_001407 [Vermiconidia calcicola]KAK5548470.1 hypothetical protein LTR23_001600 [Chaetothyriales sp. CCFEE 6169]KAK5197261.1 hypothetical protein LTR92_003200 [Exophiala xenobiotica]KAK5274360.1 hypothetical protein LTR96_000961 [Exophiala xenobiotica]